MSRPQSRREEIANCLTHGVGAAASLAVGAGLVILAVLRGDALHVVGAVVFTVSLVVLYTLSALYHGVPAPALKRRLKVADHCAIYGLIAGSYTAFLLGGVRGGTGWTLLAVAWGLAAAGIVFKLFFTGRFPRLSTALYVAMGWMIVVAAGPVAETLPGPVLAWLAAGGLAYTAGVGFYASRRIPFGHAIWHLFVMAGSTLHAVALALLILAG